MALEIDSSSRSATMTADLSTSAQRAEVVDSLSSSAQDNRRSPILSVIVPTFNERSNISTVIEALDRSLIGFEWEVIFVDDDSPDGTADVVRSIARENTRVRCVQRIARRGLSEACVEGMLASSAPYLAVMDGDLQHDPVAVREMLIILEGEEVELVIGSRYVEGGSCGSWPKQRRRISQFASLLSRPVLSQDLRDPMSNFFAMRRELLEEVVRGMSKIGFKILLDILLTARRPVRIREIPFVLGERKAGESKLSARIAWEYAMLLVDKTVGRYIPTRLLAFATIGLLGLGVNLGTLSIGFNIIGFSFIISETLATLISMGFNYTLNNILTYSDRRKRGLEWFTGLISFCLICGIGAAANIGIAAYLFNHHADWLVSAVLGAIVGVVWNYAVTSLYTWGGTANKQYRS